MKFIQKYKDLGASIFVHEYPDHIFLSEFRLPDDLQRQGIGSDFMQDLVSYADQVKKTIFLTPDTSFGSSRAGLDRFYKRFGFVLNKGKNKDWRRQAVMLRNPVVAALNVKYHTVLVSDTDCKPGDIKQNQQKVAACITTSDIYPEHPHKTHAPDGIEVEPHITVLFGLVDSDDFVPIKEYCSQLEPIHITIGHLSAFRDPEKPYDVLKCSIESPQLEKLHYWIRKNFKNECQYEYSPHMTIAYIRKGTCADMEGPIEWTGAQYVAKSLTFSDKDHGWHRMDLNKKLALSSVAINVDNDLDIIIEAALDPKPMMRALIQEFFPGMEEPDIKVTNPFNPKYLGSATMNAKMERPLIKIHRSILTDEETLERVLAHELIHCYQYITDPAYVEYFKLIGPESVFRKKYLPDGHGTFFQKMAAKINSSRGKDFVNEKSDSTYITQDDREFYLFIERYQDKFSTSTFLKFTPKVETEIERRLSSGEGKLIKTSDKRFLMPVNLGPSGKGRYVLRDPSLQAELKTMFESARENEVLASNYQYAMALRPLSVATAPKGYIDYLESEEYKHGIVVYDRKLSDNEIRSFELIPLGKDQVDKCFNAFQSDISEYKEAILADEEALEMALDNFISKEDYAYKIVPTDFKDFKKLIEKLVKTQSSEASDDSEASILDLPKNVLNPDIWDNNLEHSPRLKEDLRSEILREVKILGSSYNLGEILSVHFYGGNASLQWRKGGDIDVSIGVQNYDLNRMKEIKKIEIDYHGYPIHFFLKPDSSIEYSEAVYDVVSDMWLLAPITYPEGFNVDSWFGEDISKAESICKDLDSKLGELKRLTKDLEVTLAEPTELLQNPEVQKEKIKKIRLEMKSLLYSLVSMYMQFKTARQVSHENLKSDQNRMPMARFSTAEIVWKYLEKMGYLDALHELASAFDHGDFETL